MGVLISICAGLVAPAHAADGASNPARPIRMVIPFPAGGSIDIVGRS
jgi:tripartite-type tricarboxylate transporter receptor subunit TctC